jgi:hypothetical protein
VIVAMPQTEPLTLIRGHAVSSRPGTASALRRGRRVASQSAPSEPTPDLLSVPSALTTVDLQQAQTNKSNLGHFTR